MKITDFKTGLFGYKKEGVYRYIAMLHDRHSETLNAATQRNEAKIKELTAENKALQAQLDALRTALSECKTGCLAIIKAVSDVCGEYPDVPIENRQKPETMQGEDLQKGDESLFSQLSDTVEGEDGAVASSETNLSVFQRKSQS